MGLQRKQRVPVQARLAVRGQLRVLHQSQLQQRETHKQLLGIGDSRAEVVPQGQGSHAKALLPGHLPESQQQRVH